MKLKPGVYTQDHVVKTAKDLGHGETMVARILSLLDQTDLLVRPDGMVVIQERTKRPE